MICSECVLGFFSDPVKIGIVGFSIVVAAVSLYLIFRRDLPLKARASLVYLHVFALAFPIVFYFFFSGCSALFSGCSKLLPMVYLTVLTGIVSAIVGSLATPFLFVYGKSRSSLELKDSRLVGFLRKECLIAGVRVPRVFVLNSAKPVAYSFSGFRPVIFISAGLLDLLTRKEAESVFLHELSHVKGGSSLVKFSSFFLRFFAPLSGFAFRHELDMHEVDADAYAASRQGSGSFISSAKQKINGYYDFQESK